MTANQGIIIDKANREGLEDSVGQSNYSRFFNNLLRK